MKFVDKKVDTFLEISEAALGWYQANILSKEEAAELGQLDQYVEKIAAREAEQKLLAPTTPAADNRAGSTTKNNRSNTQLWRTTGRKRY